MEKKLKTLKDLRLPEEMKTQNPLGYRALEILVKELKAEAVKWVKEDKKILKIIHPTQYKLYNGFLELWMKRLNITEEDLE